MVLVTSAPALAQVEQEDEQEGESGEVDQSFEVSGSGSNGNQCAPIQGVGQSGNAQGLTDVIQSDSDADDFEFEENGSSITSSPGNSTECVQEVNQAASAAGKAAPAPAPAPAPPPKAAPAPAPKAAPAPAPKPAPAPAPKPEEKKAEAKKAEAKKEEKKELPKTGGSGAASLFALGTGALLVTGGLLVRRIAR
jgi:LPXTG-motif cell wall-anchored protein